MKLKKVEIHKYKSFESEQKFELTDGITILVGMNELDSNINQIIIQINKHIGKDRFNHYRPANELVKLASDKSFFSKQTLDRFENLFTEINKLFS